MDTHRDNVLNRAFAEPDEWSVCGLRIRRISISSMAMLQQIGNPFGSADPPETPSPREIAEFVWIHAAPYEDVEKTVWQTPTQATREAARFCLDIPQEQFPSIMAAVARDAEAFKLAKVDVLADESATSKNAQRPPSSQ